MRGCSDQESAAWVCPKTYVKSITISFKGQEYSLDASDMYDAWGSRRLEYPGVIRYFGCNCFDKTNCQLRGIFADGAATFVAEWRIIDGRSVRTVFAFDDDIVDLFMKNIDPPEYSE